MGYVSVWGMLVHGYVRKGTAQDIFILKNISMKVCVCVLCTQYYTIHGETIPITCSMVYEEGGIHGV